jgi:hypothetical protein
MKKINSTVNPNIFIMENKAEYVEKTNTELSTFGSFVYKNGEIILNKVGGTLARLKRNECEEGGIAINNGVISGICVVNFN